jgi:cytochrome d ubiquinol oxidase subunit II
VDLTTGWFVAVAVLWVGYLALEGFDFGVGMLLPVLGRDDTDRRVLINTIGPVWDGNEVWLLAAVGAMFAAFPGWYATVLSSLYLPVLTIVIALVVRGVAFEFRHRRDDRRWRAVWDAAIVAGSVVPAAGWGAILATLVAGLPVDASGVAAASVGLVLTPTAVLGATVTVLLCLAHGAVFVSLKTSGDIRARARRVAGVMLPLAATTVVVGAVVLAASARSGASIASMGVAAIALAAAAVAVRRGREGRAFAATGLAIAGTVAAVFLALFPDVVPSTLDPRWSLTAAGTASSPYTLTIITWAALVLLPAVVAYQAWTYWVFRQRIGRHDIPVGH